MGHIIHKAAYTPFIKEAWDFAEGLVSLEGEIFSYPRDIGVAFMTAALMDDAINAFESYEPGDVAISNDPYTTGGLCTHLPDIHLWRPYFYQGELVCFIWTFIHSSDVGGLVPGSIAPSAYDIYQEGIRLPATKLYKAGVINQEVMDIFLANCRIPYHNQGDIQAQLSAMGAAEKRLDDTIDRYGLALFRSGIGALLDYGEERARDVISRVPDGVYSISDYMELDITGEAPARLKLSLEVIDDELHLDFSGTDPQVRAALNLPTFGKNHHFINAAILNFVYACDHSIPINRGVLRPIRVTIPEGSILNPEPTAAIGVRFATVVRVLDMIMGALSLATDGDKPAPAEVSQRVPTAGAGLLGVILLAISDQNSGELKVNVIQPMWGGSGARPIKDGIDGADFAAGYLRNIPAETSEAEMPIIIKAYGLIDESPPPGKWRGSLGINLEFQVFTPNALVTARGMERYQMRPWGRKNGSPGTLGRTILNPGTNREQEVGKIFNSLQLEPNDVVQIITPSGGAYGDPFERDWDLVLRDWLDGYLTAEDARSQYGVVIADGTVDEPATTELRAQTIRPEFQAFSFGPEREAFEKSFPEPIQDALVGLLEQFPASLRQYWKNRVWREVQEMEEVTAENIGQILSRCRSELSEVALG